MGAQVVLSATVLLLVWIAVEDLRRFRIGNGSNLGLAGLFLVYCVVERQPGLLGAHAAFATAMFLSLLIPFALNWMGGGDLKLLSAAFLWTGLECALLFTALLCAATLLYAVAEKLHWVPSVPQGERRKVPFGPPLAFALGTAIVICRA